MAAEGSRPGCFCLVEPNDAFSLSLPLPPLFNVSEKEKKKRTARVQMYDVGSSFPGQSWASPITAIYELPPSESSALSARRFHPVVQARALGVPASALMANIQMTLCLLLLLFSSTVLSADGRPIKQRGGAGYMKPVATIREQARRERDGSQGSTRGSSHGSLDLASLGYVKESGPSPGDGH